MYTEHSKAQAHGFEAVDTTHDDPNYWVGDFIWVSSGSEGRWLTAAQAEEVAGIIFGAAAAQRARHATKAPA